MNRSRTVLVVASTLSLGRLLAGWLEESGCVVDVVKTYADGKVHLDNHPDSLITELELGAYNGLQLALHARATHIPSVVVGPPDIVLQREAEQLGITYIRKDHVSGDRLLTVIDRQAEETTDASPPVGEDDPFNAGPFVQRRGVVRRMSVH